MSVNLKELAKMDINDQSDPKLDERIKKFDESMLQLSPRQRDRVAFARMFRFCLKALGISQKKLAEKLGVSQALISSWASAASLPNAEQTEKLSEIFNDNVALWSKYDRPLPEYPPEDYNQIGIVSVPGFTLTDDEIALVQRVRRMSEDERAALYTLLHVLR